MRISAAFALLILVTGLALPAAATGAGARWQPAAQLTWQVQFNGRIDVSVEADVFDLDAFDTHRRTVTRLHRSGRRAVCYINAGAWEDWRPDAARFPEAILGRALDGWPGERWLAFAGWTCSRRSCATGWRCAAQKASMVSSSTTSTATATAPGSP